MVEFALVEGDESIVEYVGQYKKVCLSKKVLLKNTRDRLEKKKATGHDKFFLIITHTVLFLMFCVVGERYVSTISTPCFPLNHHSIIKERHQEFRGKCRSLGFMGPHELVVALPSNIQLCACHRLR